jgi:starch synthase
MPMYILSHPTGNQNMRHAALALLQGGLLGEVWTCLGWRDDHPLTSCLPRRLRAEVARRTFPPEIASRLHLRPWQELGRLAAMRLGWSSLIAHEHGTFCIDQVYRDLDRCVAARLADGDGCGMAGVYAYEDGAADSFRAAERLGLNRIYDLPIGYWRAFEAICDDERQAEPAWADTLIGTLDSQAKRARKDCELSLSTSIMVATNYTASTLSSYPGALPRCTVIPYGSPPPHPGPRTWSTAGPLRVLFVGSLSQRKGISYLFNAVAGLGNHVDLTVIGSRTRPCAELDRALARHRYIPTLPHQEILAEMRQHDALLFPSLFEGFGLVITEAMSQGLPVITTPHTAGPDVIEHGVDGFIVPIRSVAAITEHLDRLIRDRPLLRQMGLAALAAAARRPWSNYHSLLLNALAPSAATAPAAAPQHATVAPCP